VQQLFFLERLDQVAVNADLLGAVAMLVAPRPIITNFLWVIGVLFSYGSLTKGSRAVGAWTYQ